MNAVMENTLAQGKNAFLQMACLSCEEKNISLERLATLIEENQDAILDANDRDLAENKDALDNALYQRLKLDAGKLKQVVQGIRQLVKLDDPAGKVLATTELDDGLILTKRAVPLGLIGIIFESRPDVMPQILSLILKSGNAVVFKGGKEAKHSNQAFMDAVIHPLTAELDFLPEGWASLMESREDVQAMLNYPQYVDLVIPRGSNQLVQSIMEKTRIPVLGHADGVCHQYVHGSADLDKALEVVIDSKTQYPSACNALETLLVDEAIADAFLPRLAQRCENEGITLHACEASITYLPKAKPATPSDWTTEYGTLTLAVKLVLGVEAAIAHINQYSSHHTDGILAEESAVQARFLKAVDSASVFVNASTRFADGFRYGFGAEIGISTARTHARGPVGLEGLVTYKFELTGHHQLVKDYVGASPARQFTHRTL
ncbi:MAG: glutamate-5-semialdehyde dehydrogenase [Vampirovibrionales bacterium]|jgi:glutamate-5-semialdehyde dehydrogenase|nr:glutamate-5-semialdehyde dehydrogenase [Vampirovibrionales bacterium]